MNRAVAWLERDYDEWEWEAWPASDGSDELLFFTWRPADHSHQERSVYVPRLMIDLIDQSSGWDCEASTECRDLDDLDDDEAERLRRLLVAPPEGPLG